ncbi:hypothetical protein CSA37_12005 [Candidatus Fermentibacteria bacterium]|nr:MAG: hypothetical protein CSA37_12005 [Candidatus Fermentibacteria bacterium]
MNTYPAVRDPGSIELIFRRIRSSTPPDKVTKGYLEAAGFRRQTDLKLLELLFFLGFIDSSLSPSNLWKNSVELEEKDFASLLGASLSKAYAGIFKKYPRGSSIDGRSLMELFKKETGVSDTEAAYMVLTVQVLSDIADFSGNLDLTANTSPVVPAPESPAETRADNALNVSAEPAPTISVPENGITLNITIPPELVDNEIREIVKTLLKKLS